MRTKELKLIIAFKTTTAAMNFETYCKEHGITGRLIPIPREITAGCGFSWCTIPSERLMIEELIRKNQIPIDGIYELRL